MNNWVIYSLIVIIIVLGFIRSLLQSSLSTTGNELLAYQQKIDRVRMQNQELEDQYLEETSLRVIEQKAGSMEFGPAQYIYF